MSRIPQENLGEALEAAVREAVDDNTFRKVKRCSYAQSGQDTIGHILGLGGGGGGNNRNSRNDGNININDPAILDQLVTALLGQQVGQNTTPHQAFNRMRPMSRSMRQGSTRVKNENSRSSWFIGQNQGGSSGGNGSGLPTIMEGNAPLKNNANNARTLSLSEKALNTPLVRNFLQTLSNAPQKLNVSSDSQESRNTGRLGRRNSETPLTQNQL